MRDYALAKSLLAAGHRVSLLPMYLPLQLDEETLSQTHNPIFFGGINVYLQQNVSLFRHTPRWLDDFLNNSKLLRFVAKRSHMTSARVHGAMALAMLRIEGSHTATACGSYCLAVGFILHISGSKYAFDIGFGCTRHRHDITGFIHIDEGLENIAVRLMSNGHKKGAHRNITYFARLIIPDANGFYF
jgi:hypothetical protein